MSNTVRKLDPYTVEELDALIREATTPEDKAAYRKMRQEAMERGWRECQLDTYSKRKREQSVSRSWN